MLRICGPKRDDVIEEWRKLHSEELNVLKLELLIMHDLYSSPNNVQGDKNQEE